jgi:hypothetical protein
VKTLLLLCVLAVLAMSAAPVAAVAAQDSTKIDSRLRWPEFRGPETRPWTWWWWHGNAVSKAETTAELEEMHASGIGGVCIVEILDVLDDQATSIPYPSKEWIETVAHVVREARRLGMEVDISPVSGWAFGGPWVPPGDASAVVRARRVTLGQARELMWLVGGGRDVASRSLIPESNWIWDIENSAVSASAATRFFKRMIEVDPEKALISARAVTTADNAFTLWINGTQVAKGDNWQVPEVLDIKEFLRPGPNVLAVAATNAGPGANPAGLIAAFELTYDGGGREVIRTDASWQVGSKESEGWNLTSEPLAAGRVATVLGKASMAPWNLPVGGNALVADIEDLSALMAYSPGGEILDLTDKVNENGILEWAPPSADWELYILENSAGGSSVRMPVPDGRGPVVDHLSVPALGRYFARYDEAFALINKADIPRAFMNDSWEIHLNWTGDFLDAFEKRRGYDLREHLPQFMGHGDTDAVTRVACDYRHTLSDLMRDRFTGTFRKWAAGHGRQIVGETINEPANELDLNALYDIPQADIGGAYNWFIKGGGYVTDQFFMRCKIPASAAHVLGKPLIGSESLTAMGPLFDTPLEMVKERIDHDLVSGINHITFHGISYSPAHVRWPGWLFYAGVHLGSFNPMWRNTGRQLCDYIARCQSFLQAGRPDCDVLVYDPVFDQWTKRFAREDSAPALVSFFSNLPPISQRLPAADELWRAGHDFDFVSDRLLEAVEVLDGKLVAPGSSYQAIVVSNCKFMPDTTLERIISLAREGATVIMHGPLPVDVPGLGSLEKRRAAFKAARSQMMDAKTGSSGVASFGKGRIVFADDVLAGLAQAGIRRESMMDTSLRYVRRQDKDGTVYFITNLAAGKRVDGWVQLAATGKAAVIFDPMTGSIGKGSFRATTLGSEAWLQLDPRESLIVRVLEEEVEGPLRPDYTQAAAANIVAGPWEVRFLEGGEVVPEPETIENLSSWTQWESEQSEVLRYFSGSARYTARFQKPNSEADAWAIELGEVCHTARVWLNGEHVGDLIGSPMRLVVDDDKLDGENVLEIEVANAPANRLAGLDIKNIRWQNTIGENQVDMTMGCLFRWPKKDKSWEPLASGLMGPVQVVPLRRKTDHQ